MIASDAFPRALAGKGMAPKKGLEGEMLLRQVTKQKARKTFLFQDTFFSFFRPRVECPKRSVTPAEFGTGKMGISSWKQQSDGGSFKVSRQMVETAGQGTRQGRDLSANAPNEATDINRQEQFCQPNVLRRTPGKKEHGYLALSSSNLQQQETPKHSFSRSIHAPELTRTPSDGSPHADCPALASVKERSSEPRAQTPLRWTSAMFVQHLFSEPAMPHSENVDRVAVEQATASNLSPPPFSSGVSDGLWDVASIHKASGQNTDTVLPPLSALELDQAQEEDALGQPCVDGQPVEILSPRQGYSKTDQDAAGKGTAPSEPFPENGPLLQTNQSTADSQLRFAAGHQLSEDASRQQKTGSETKPVFLNTAKNRPLVSTPAGERFSSSALREDRLSMPERPDSASQEQLFVKTAAPRRSTPLSHHGAATDRTTGFESEMSDSKEPLDHGKTGQENRLKHLLFSAETRSAATEKTAVLPRRTPSALDPAGGERPKDALGHPQVERQLAGGPTRNVQVPVPKESWPAVQKENTAAADSLAVHQIDTKAQKQVLADDRPTHFPRVNDIQSAPEKEPGLRFFGPPSGVGQPAPGQPTSFNPSALAQFEDLTPKRRTPSTVNRLTEPQLSGDLVRDATEQKPVPTASAFDSFGVEEELAAKSSANAKAPSPVAAEEGKPDLMASAPASANKPFTGQAKSFTGFPAAFLHSDQGAIMTQIVAKASLRTLQEQAELQVRLKPEFLGHVRMRISTYKEQLVVRIVTDQMRVKEVIEANLQHLKVELQRHGLNIDTFDVVVNPDAEQQNGRDPFSQSVRDHPSQGGRQQANTGEPGKEEGRQATKDNPNHPAQPKPQREEKGRRKGISHFA